MVGITPLMIVTIVATPYCGEPDTTQVGTAASMLRGDWGTDAFPSSEVHEVTGFCDSSRVTFVVSLLGSDDVNHNALKDFLESVFGHCQVEIN